MSDIYTVLKAVQDIQRNGYQKFSCNHSFDDSRATTDEIKLPAGELEKHLDIIKPGLNGDYGADNAFDRLYKALTEAGFKLVLFKHSRLDRETLYNFCYTDGKLTVYLNLCFDDSYQVARFPEKQAGELLRRYIDKHHKGDFYVDVSFSDRRNYGLKYYNEFKHVALVKVRGNEVYIESGPEEKLTKFMDILKRFCEEYQLVKVGYEVGYVNNEIQHEVVYRCKWLARKKAYPLTLKVYWTAKNENAQITEGENE